MALTIAVCVLPSCLFLTEEKRCPVKLKDWLVHKKRKRYKRTSRNLGLLNCYHNFLANKSHPSEALHRLLDKGMLCKWTERHEKALSLLKPYKRNMMINCQ
ncbi:hypothetical protein T03_4536 [Trichinella britovi]|uniref:Uncharacterized protein n=1 Tax=Trichinella britovi TaxID=45882 RepID=A0A0V1CUM3_TRIBR|nr:hypothetical protein T03_4536 [Trichinella britovi]